MSQPRILCVFPALIPSTLIAVRHLQGLAASGKIQLQLQLEPRVTQAEIRDADLLLFCRNCDPAHRQVLDQVLELGKPYIYELDDNFWEIPLDTPVGRYHRSKRRLDELERFLTHAALVRVYRPILREKAEEFNSNVDQVEAGFDFSLLPDAGPKRKQGRLRIVYSTSRVRDPLYKIFEPALLQLLEEKSDTCEMVFLGASPEGFTHLPNCRRKGIVPDYVDFLQGFTRAGYDIGLAPMPAARFFQSKTNNKFREYGAARIAGVYSDVSVYSTCVQHGVSGLLVGESTEGWYHALKRLVEDEELRTSIQRNAYDYVFEHHRMEVVERRWIAEIETVLRSDRVKSSTQARGTRVGKGEVLLRPDRDRLRRILIRSLPDSPIAERAGNIELVTASSRQSLRSARLQRIKGQLAVSFEPIWNSAHRDFVALMDADLAQIFENAEVQFEYANARRRSVRRRS